MNQVSIIVPCYNVEQYIEKTIIGFAEQECKDFEVIFIDDCSNDNSVAKIYEYINKYRIRARIIECKENRGPSIARKIGIEYSDTKYVGFCDSDDWFDKRFISKMLEAADKGNHDIIFCNYNLVYSSGRIIKRVRIKNDIYFKSMHDYFKIDVDSLWNGIYKRRLFDNIEFPNIRNGEDMAIIPVLISRARTIKIVTECLYNYYQREGSLSKKQTDSLVDNLRCSFWYIYSNIDKDLYYREVEYLGIRNLLYGALLNIFKQSLNKEYALEIVNDFKRVFPDWINNKYISKLPISKRLYLKFIQYEFWGGCFLLSRLHTLLTI